MTCKPCKFMKWCPGGIVSNCSGNRHGPGCSQCPDGYHSTPIGECSKCPNPDWIFLRMLLTMVAGVAYIIFLYINLGRNQDMVQYKSKFKSCVFGCRKMVVKIIRGESHRAEGDNRSRDVVGKDEDSENDELNRSRTNTWASSTDAPKTQTKKKSPKLQSSVISDGKKEALKGFERGKSVGQKKPHRSKKRVVKRRKSAMNKSQQMDSGGAIARLAILLNHIVQINIVIPSLPLPNLPRWLSNYLSELFDFFSVDVSNVVTSAECDVSTDLYTSIIFKLLTPVAVGFLCLLCAMIFKCIHHQSKDLQQESYDRIVGVFCYIYITNLIVSTTDQVATLYDCTYVGGYTNMTGTWDEDPSIPCSSVPAWPAVLLFVAFTFVPLCFILDNAYGVDICKHKFACCTMRLRQLHTEDELLKLQEEALRRESIVNRSSFEVNIEEMDEPVTEYLCCIPHWTCCPKDESFLCCGTNCCVHTCDDGREHDKKRRKKSACVFCCSKGCCKRKSRAPILLVIFGAYKLLMLGIYESIGYEVIGPETLFWERLCSNVSAIIVLVSAMPCSIWHPCSRKKLDKIGEVKQYLDRFSWLFTKYKSVEVCYWEMLVLVRKVLLLLIAKFLTAKAIISMPLMMVVLLSSMYLQFKYKPYTNDFEDEDGTTQFYNDANNRLEMLLLGAQVIFTIGGFVHGCLRSAAPDLTDKEIGEVLPAPSFIAAIFEYLGVLSIVVAYVYAACVHFRKPYLEAKKRAMSKSTIDSLLDFFTGARICQAFMATFIVLWMSTSESSNPTLVSAIILLVFSLVMLGLQILLQMIDIHVMPKDYISIQMSCEMLWFFCSLISICSVTKQGLVDHFWQISIAVMLIIILLQAITLIKSWNLLYDKHIRVRGKEYLFAEVSTSFTANPTHSGTENYILQPNELVKFWEFFSFSVAKCALSLIVFVVMIFSKTSLYLPVVAIFYAIYIGTVIIIHVRVVKHQQALTINQFVRLHLLSDAFGMFFTITSIGSVGFSSDEDNNWGASVCLSILLSFVHIAIILKGWKVYRVFVFDSEEEKLPQVDTSFRKSKSLSSTTVNPLFDDEEYRIARKLDNSIMEFYVPVRVLHFVTSLCSVCFLSYSSTSTKLNDLSNTIAKTPEKSMPFCKLALSESAAACNDVIVAKNYMLFVVTFHAICAGGLMLFIFVIRCLRPHKWASSENTEVTFLQCQILFDITCLILTIFSVSAAGASIGDTEWRAGVFFLSTLCLLQLFTLQKGMDMVRRVYTKRRQSVEVDKNISSEDKVKSEHYGLMLKLIDASPFRVIEAPKDQIDIAINKSCIMWYIWVRMTQVILSLILFVTMMISQVYQNLKSFDNFDSKSMRCHISCQQVSIAADVFASMCMLYVLLMSSLLVLLLLTANGRKLFTMKYTIQLQRYGDVVGFVVAFFNAALLGFAFGDVAWKLSVIGAIALTVTHVATLRHNLRID
eukprot:g3967.t1